MDHQLISDVEAMDRVHQILVRFFQSKVALSKAMTEIAEAIEAGGRPIMRETAMDWVDARTDEQRSWAPSDAEHSASV